jgi:ATP/ADP translocase
MDENDKFKDLNRLLETLEKYSVKSKDYIKFVTGLSTGTLVFSAALAKEFIKTPQYQFILIIAWACLFISIILGVWILPGGDKLQSLMETLKRLLAESPEKIKSFVEKKLQDGKGSP